MPGDQNSIECAPQGLMQKSRLPRWSTHVEATDDSNYLGLCCILAARFWREVTEQS
jgi:hypothetical protein